MHDGVMQKRLVELLLKSDPLHERDLDDDLADGEIKAIADHLLAGGVVVPPCKVGQTVYTINPLKCKLPSAIEEYEITGFGWNAVHKEVYALDRWKAQYYKSDLGENWFLAREEAEKALAERSEG